MANPTALERLRGILESGGARPNINPSRLAPSAVYDLEYRVSIIASVFEIHSKSYLLGKRRMRASHMKLLQFVAIRPWLVPVIRQWSESLGFAQQSMFSPQQLRRGFLGDREHDSVVAFLVARGVVERIDAHVVSGANADVLMRLHLAATKNELFSASLQALRDLTEIRITNDMLEGW
jgi:hypothetical protein